MKIKLQQDQIWKQGELYFKITHWDRLYIVYKTMSDLKGRDGKETQLSKKEFCRLIKGAELLTPEQVRLGSGKGL
ncbi:hypothetical protein SAMN02745166_04502 [Prosthecobacter debontii]|uniref:Uncharacterized protein n=1 Tax=Prosthecobacter debontii TaxID=48467 RepID=A0A1T4YXY8_9BACT|nr:hypothetical protein [Prosthecobacter debontii]SKB06644.1 hypothetical protein SAMN02745166_04502 [Prosthecobacter debontii]